MRGARAASSPKVSRLQLTTCASARNAEAAQQSLFAARIQLKTHSPGGEARIEIFRAHATRQSHVIVKGFGGG